ncbi:hypothetical protein QCE73_11040 [Caballeronia sp. LZ029]|uniref:hypothetical protein n=1 Tax=Caballeronia sp. LZ029 TaxID=3038564 RepID=UPI002858FAE2|nr:hypothetical protein [Caballeronia sp. LZ029]MDR5743685.1 hypothetical protein [Caballeronia sp. LZ029]
MKDRRRATIVFYDEDSQQLQVCTVRRDAVQSAIAERTAAGFVFNLPADRADRCSEPVTDEHARLIGCMAILSQAQAHPELRPRLQITTANPMNWEPIERPDQ